MLEEEAVFPSNDSVDPRSSRESWVRAEPGVAVSRAGTPRLLAGCSLLFLLCKLPQKVNVLEG